MLRTLIAAAILTAIAVRLGASFDNTAAYIFVGALTLWFTWPVLRRITHATGRIRRRHRNRRRPAPRPATTAPAQTLTQINHYHFYGNTKPQPSAVNPTQRSLPRYGDQQIAHNIVYGANDDS